MAKTRRVKRARASQTLTTPGKTYTLRRGGEGTPKGSRKAAPLLLPLISRLRRLEVLILHQYGHLKMDDAMVQKMLDNIQVMKDDTKDLGAES